MKTASTKEFFKKSKKALIALGVVIVAGAVYLVVASGGAPSFASYAVTRGDVTETVDVSGSVSAEHDVNLSFQESGQVSAIPVTEGESVQAGAVLAKLNTASLSAAVDQAKAALAAAQAKLDGMESGTRPAEIKIDEGTVQNAELSLAAALESTYAAADDAVHNKTDNLFSDPEGINPTFLVSTPDGQLAVDIQAERIALSDTFNNWYAVENGTSSDIASRSAAADAALAKIEPYLNNLALAVNNALPSGSVTASEIAGFKADVVAARTEVTTAGSALAGAEAALTTAKNTLALAEEGYTSHDIEAQQAAVLQAKAAVSSAEVALSHAVIEAPFSGSISNLNVKVGQVVSAGTPVATITNSDGLKLDAYVSENDVAKIQTGDDASVTLDAYGTGVSFPATVTSIASAETKVNGAPAYEVTIHFTKNDERIKDGMTGSARITAASRSNVLEVPNRLILSDGNDYFVLVKNGSKNEKRSVQIGITGDNGMTEITSGVAAGEELVNF